MRKLEKLEEALSGTSNRRGFIGAIFRGFIGIAATTAALCSGLPAFADSAVCNYNGAQSPGGAGDTCNDGAGYSESYCTGNPSSWGCTISSGGIRACNTDDGCNGTVAALTSSNCGQGNTSSGYWDCCCEGKTIRFRDCSVGGSIVCICRAWIGTCVPQNQG